MERLSATSAQPTKNLLNGPKDGNPFSSERACSSRAFVGYGRVIATKRFTHQGEIQGGGDHKRLPKLPGAFESMRVGCNARGTRGAAVCGTQRQSRRPSRDVGRLERMKAGREHRVPLSERACQILAAMQLDRRGNRVLRRGRGGRERGGAGQPAGLTPCNAAPHKRSAALGLKPGAFAFQAQQPASVTSGAPQVKHVNVSDQTRL
jgi:hypothetical protein